MTLTTNLSLTTFDSVTDAEVYMSEFFSKDAENSEIIDSKLGPFVATGLYVDEDGDVCQAD